MGLTRSISGNKIGGLGSLAPNKTFLLGRAEQEGKVLKGLRWSLSGVEGDTDFMRQISHRL